MWSRDRDPTNIYRVYEIIKFQGGKYSPCAVGNLAPAAQTSRFTHSVNHPKAAGDRARHARMATESPADPMSEPEMVRFISELIVRWIHCLAGQLGVPTKAAISNA